MSKRIASVIGIVALVSLVGFVFSRTGQGAPNQDPKPAPGQAATQPSRSPGPPPESFAACEGKARDTECSFPNRRGDTVTGKCLSPRNDDKLNCVPNHKPRLGMRGQGMRGQEMRGQGMRGQGMRGQGMRGPGRTQPPPEAITACDGKADGAQCQFAGCGGETVKGACGLRGDSKKPHCMPVGGPPRGPQAKRGPGMHGPGPMNGSGPGGHRGPPPESIAVCQGKTAGAECEFANRHGDQMTGACGVHNEAGLRCMPANRPARKAGQSNPGPAKP